MFLKGTPQANALNPAMKLQEKDKWYLAFPALGSIQTDVSTAAFTWNNATYIEDNTLYFNIPKLTSALKNDNPINANVSVQMLGFGFKIKDKHYVSFDLNTKVKSTTNVPGSLLNLQYGTWDVENNTPINHHINDLTVDAISYVEAALGYNYQINDKLNVGARFKYIQGAVASKTNHMEVHLVTGEDGSLHTTQNIRQQIMGPVNITTKEDGTIDEITFAEDADEITDSTVGKNIGFGFDVGATYKISDKLTIGFSMIDLGKINWKGKVQEIYTEGSFNYNDPIDVSGDITGNDSEEEKITLDDYLDDLESSFKLYPDSMASFSTSLFRSTNLSAQYELKDWVSFGGLFQIDHVGDASATLATTLSPGKALSATLSYTASKNSASSFGAGLMLRGGFFQFYLLTDHLNSLLTPADANYVNFQMGINFVF